MPVKKSQRKDFTASERVEIGKLLEEKLGNRQGQRTDLDKELVPELEQVQGKKTIELAAEKVGMSALKPNTTKTKCARILHRQNGWQLVSCWKKN